MNQTNIHTRAVDCLKIIKCQSANIEWYNVFCKSFLSFSENLHTHLLNTEQRMNNDIIFLSLLQICNCIKCMEYDCKLQHQPVDHNRNLMTSNRHFSDRIRLCLERLCSALDKGAEFSSERNYCELMNMLFDYLEPYETEDYDEHSIPNYDINTLRGMVDEILGKSLAFANIALDEDKRALGSLCQQVFRECVNFQAECKNVQQVSSNRKLIAISLINALYKLEDYINKTLLRLIYICFMSYEKYSIEKLRTMQLCGNIDESTLDEFIADFDVNIDRTTQIGAFATAFASNVKTRTIVQSCLASFESLDSFLIPAILSKPCEHLITIDILEQHFNEEITNFKNAIQEIIDSYAFSICYQEEVNRCILLMEKEFCKNNLEDIVDMGQILCEHFELKCNHIQLENSTALQKCYNKFAVILRECAAILVCCKQIDEQRILKRFKILRSVLGKFVEVLFQIQIPDVTTECDQSIFFSSNKALMTTSLVRQNINRNIEHKCESTITKTRAKVLKKDSLRTQIFKCKKIEANNDVESAEKTCSNNETSFLMGEILNQLTLLSIDSHA